MTGEAGGKNKLEFYLLNLGVFVAEHSIKTLTKAVAEV